MGHNSRMSKLKKTALLLILWAALVGVAATAVDQTEEFWPQWRGPLATGVSPHGNPPLTWSETENVRWKVPISGQGHSSPVVWGDRIFVTTAAATGVERQPAAAPEESESTPRWRRGGSKPTQVMAFKLLALNRSDGSVAWERTAVEDLPHEGHHQDGSWASNSPVTDGKHVYAFFGSRGVFCYDWDGNLKWQKDLGDMQTRLGFGEGASPALYGDKLFVNWDHEGPSFTVALDKLTGREIWRVERDEITSWSTPLVVKSGDGAQVVINATNRVRSYDVDSGRLIWESSGMTVNTIPSPVFSKGIVYVTSGFRGNALQAIRVESARGDLAQSDAIVWQYNRDTPYVPSPLLYGDKLYFLKSNNAILSCFNAMTGEEFYSRQRIDGLRGIYASPIGAAGRVYLVGRDGNTAVISNGPEYEQLALNALDDPIDASPAVVGDEMFIRSHHHLYSLAED